jgi:putative alpha-1,2-mannosidase
MSAWLVMSALGVYQVCPGCGAGGDAGSKAARAGGGGGEYVLTTPLFDDIIIHLPARGASTQSAGSRSVAIFLSPHHSPALSVVVALWLTNTGVNRT